MIGHVKFGNYVVGRTQTQEKIQVRDVLRARVYTRYYRFSARTGSSRWSSFRYLLTSGIVEEAGALWDVGGAHRGSRELALISVRVGSSRGRVRGPGAPLWEGGELTGA